MLICNGIVSALHAQPMRDAEDICQGMTFWRNKLKAGHLKQLTIGITEVDRVHEAAINGTRIFDAEFLQARCHLCISRARNIVGKMMQVTNVLWIWCRIVDPRRTHKKSDQASIARVKIKVKLIRHIQIRLFEYERHAQHALIE